MKLFNRKSETIAFDGSNEYEENYARGAGKILLLLIIVKNGELIGNNEVRYSVDLYNTSWNKIQTYPNYIVGSAATYQAVSFDYDTSSIIGGLKLIVEPKKTSGHFIVLRFQELFPLPKESADAVMNILKIQDYNTRAAFKTRIQYLLKAFSPSLDHSFMGAWAFVDIGTGQTWTFPQSQQIQTSFLYNRY